jgi:hypothetical protein
MWGFDACRVTVWSNLKRLEEEEKEKRKKRR